MFPDVEKPKTEPYLEYEDLFDKPKTFPKEACELLARAPSRMLITLLPSTQNNLNLSQQPIQEPLSHNEWLEDLKRRRKKLGWW